MLFSQNIPMNFIIIIFFQKCLSLLCFSSGIWRDSLCVPAGDGRPQTPNRTGAVCHVVCCSGWISRVVSDVMEPRPGCVAAGGRRRRREDWTVRWLEVVHQRVDQVSQFCSATFDATYLMLRAFKEQIGHKRLTSRNMNDINSTIHQLLPQATIPPLIVV